MAKHKFGSISLTMQDRGISSKFSTHRVSKECIIGNFQKNFPLPKNGDHFEFSNFCQKLKNTNFLLSPEPCEIKRFRRNFQTTGYLSNVFLAIFQKFYSPQKWRPFEFSNFCPKWKTQICFYLLNRAKYSNFVKIFDPQGI